MALLVVYEMATGSEPADLTHVTIPPCAQAVQQVLVLIFHRSAAAKTQLRGRRGGPPPIIGGDEPAAERANAGGWPSCRSPSVRIYKAATMLALGGAFAFTLLAASASQLHFALHCRLAAQ